jgi:V/A-type H+-transporting ATPase subunit C
MAGYDYGNARLRAMKSRLLSRKQLEKMTGAAHLQAMIAELSSTPYRKSIEAALARVGSMECVFAALHSDLETTLKQIRRFYSDQAGEMVSVVLRAYDIRNLKAILRGLSRHALPGEIQFTLLPAGELTDDILDELSSAADPRAAIDILATMAFPYAIPLLRLRGERPGAGTPEMELRLDQWHYREAFDYLHREQQCGSALFSALQLDADIANLLTVLRFAYEPEEQNLLRVWLGADDISHAFVGPGKLSFDLLASAGSQETVGAALETLTQGVYDTPLRAGFEEYSSIGRLSVFERQLNRFRLDRLSKLIGKDPLGIGVVLGYLALKTTEVSNIRWIAHGIYLGMSANNIRSEMVYAI